MTGKAGSRRGGGKAPGAASPVSGSLLPADLGRSLRLLDDGDLDRLLRAVRAEARRRGRDGAGAAKPARTTPVADVAIGRLRPHERDYTVWDKHAAIAPGSTATDRFASTGGL